MTMALITTSVHRYARRASPFTALASCTLDCKTHRSGKLVAPAKDRVLRSPLILKILLKSLRLRTHTRRANTHTQEVHAVKL